MTRMTIYLTNNTPFNVVYLSRDGSDWDDDSGSYPTMTSLGPNSGTQKAIQSMGCPGALESDHWVWLNFRAEVPGFKGFYKFFYIYARQQDSGHCNSYGMAKAKSEGDHDDFDENKFGSSSYTPDVNNDNSPKLECTLNMHDLDW